MKGHSQASEALPRCSRGLSTAKEEERAEKCRAGKGLEGDSEGKQLSRLQKVTRAADIRVEVDVVSHIETPILELFPAVHHSVSSFASSPITLED